MRDPARARQRRQEKAAARRAAIAQLVSNDCGPDWGRAHRIRVRMDAAIRPSLRTVQSVLRDFLQQGSSPAR